MIHSPGRKILIIEDDANLLYALQAKFSVVGFHVLTMAEGDVEAAINKIKWEKPDYIILDLVRPDLIGDDLIARLKANDQTSAPPIFVFSDISTADQKSKSLDLGAEHFFTKQDFTIDEFVVKVEKIIKNREKIAAPMRAISKK